MSKTPETTTQEAEIVSAAAAATQTAAVPGMETVELDEPIKRGDTEIRTIQLRKPKAGELRGISLHALAEMDVSALQRLLPRITIPSLTQFEVDSLDLADMTALGVKVGTFLLKKADKASLGK